MKVERCEECGVPLYITTTHRWLESGAIVLAGQERSRPYFMECENIDPILATVESIIGLPVENVVIATDRRGVKTYLKGIIPEEVRKKLERREIDWQPINRGLWQVARLSGIGLYELVDFRYAGDDQDFITERVKNPFSIPVICGTTTAAIEILFAREMGVSYRREEGGSILITCRPSPHPEEYRERLMVKPYVHRGGSVELRRCASCGGPAALSDCYWDLEMGVIRHTKTGRRISILSPVMEVVLEELEEELGEEIPRAVVEAQRRYTREGFYSFHEIVDEENVREQFAWRGLGELSELRMGRKGVKMTLKSAGLSLLVVGMAQGLFEQAFKVESTVDWELDEEGTLQVEVLPVEHKISVP